ncbi:Nem1-Spo7 phosphatase regulatory subunit SPO7 NDAI_0H02650 [Naumovozyma dairenensis CBS 421]|uniref:Spo7-like protein n=1 Tax=Naumovozyma dairenensis (strain ATCC 10597 / BCRC 20456 / CBS 421 / NBRC 0211 / NRRL Y-12639) TaxID=1071378 RepID=G0WF78_NAUDC|nr:hypothetical protein NDAI_0H02650 [Naumovozyma dairenensis CBS 421]CCD26439.1 hypothetical protein NDAI_0H02650 [Naumovozyma dairenensis CBS 421]
METPEDGEKLPTLHFVDIEGNDVDVKRTIRMENKENSTSINDKSVITVQYQQEQMDSDDLKDSIALINSDVPDNKGNTTTSNGHIRDSDEDIALATNVNSNGNSGIIQVRKRSDSKTSRTSSSRNPKSSSDISSASKIFRNLLILEDDLRRQAGIAKRLKWQFTMFFSGLIGVAGFAIYELFFDYGSFNGHSNTDKSMSRLYRIFLQFTVCFIAITLVLFHLSGQYKRTIVIPRRFFVSSNKGLRQFNVKLVKVNSSMDEKYTDFVRYISRKVAHCNLFLFRTILRFSEQSTIVHFWKSVTIRSQPRIGAIDVKLIINPRFCSAEVREGWEIYRDEFWAREGARRRQMVDAYSINKTDKPHKN